MPRKYKDRRKEYHEKWKEETNRIKLRVKELREERIENMAKKLEEAKGDNQFRLMKRMVVKQYLPFTINNQSGYKHTSTQAMIKDVEDFYRGFFNADEDTGEMHEFEGEARPLQVPITEEEIERVLRKLRNNKARGPDEMHGEYLKYGGQIMRTYLAWILNQIFERHEQLAATQESTLYPLNKIGKEPTAENTQPLAFQNAIRKILSSVVL